MELLQSLLQAVFGLPDDTSTEQRQEAVKAFLAQHPNADLTALLEGATDAFSGITEDEEEVPTDEQVFQMEQLADVVSVISDTRESFAAAEADRIERARALAARLAPFKAKNEMAEDEDEEDEGREQGDEEAEENKRSKGGRYKKTAAVDASQPQLPEAAGSPETPLSAAAGTLAVKSSQQPTRVPLGRVPSTLPAHADRERTLSVTASADVPGFSSGSSLPTLKDMAEAVRSKMRTLESSGSPYLRQGIFQIRRNTDPEFTCTGAEDDWLKIEAAADEKRLSGGSLVAAGFPTGGWCAPSEILYELCPTASMDGMVDLPAITLTRGGVRWPMTPDFAAVYGTPVTVPAASYTNNPPSDIGRPFVFQETDVAGLPPTNVKPCIEVPCPDFYEERLAVVGLCLKAGILTNHAYPELIQYFLEQSMIAHAHLINAQVLARMAAASCPVRFQVQAAKAWAGGQAAANADLYPGYGAGAGILDTVELQVYDLRYRYRFGQNDTFELIVPDYAKGIMRADLAKRMGIQEPFSITDQQILEWFAIRGVRVQFVYDFFDNFNPSIPAPNSFNPAQPYTTCAAVPGLPTSTFGGPTAATAWPSMVPMLLYKAGTFIRGQADVITIDGLYDSTTLQQNRYTALFMEEGLLVGKRCFDSRLLLVDVCPTGETGGGIVPATTICAV